MQVIGYGVYWLVKNIGDNVLVLSVVLSSSVATRSLKLTNNQPTWVVKKEGWVTYIYLCEDHSRNDMGIESFQ